MDLSLRFIAEKLRMSYPVKIKNEDAKAHFSTARLYSSDLSLNRRLNPLVIASAKLAAGSNIDAFPGLLWIGPEEPPVSCPTIWVTSRVNELHVLDRVLNLFDLFNRWCGQVGDRLLKHEPIADVVTALGEVIANPYYYADAGFRTLAISDDQTLYASSSSWRTQTEVGRHPVDKIAQFISSGELDVVNNRKEAWLFDSETFHIPFVSRTIHCHGSVYGHLFAIQVNPDQQTFDVEVLEELGKMLESHLELYSYNYQASGRPFDQLLVESIENGLRNEPESDFLMRLLSWRADDSYQVIVFSAPSDEGSLDGVSSVEIQVIEDNLPCRAFVHNGQVVTVVNIARIEEIHVEVVVQSLCPRFGWKAALSNIASSFSFIDALYRQALRTIAEGRRHDPEASIYSFCDYGLAILFSSIDEVSSADLLMHNDLRTLLAHDKKTHSELVPTLKTYLDCERNGLKTAEAMFLHRNTITYRLDKIKSLISSDLDDPQNRALLMLSISYWLYRHPAAYGTDKPTPEEPR